MANSISKKKRKSKFKSIFVTILLIIAISTISIYSFYKSALGPVLKGDEENIVIEIASGSSSKKIAELLYENNLIKNIGVFRVNLKLSDKGNKLKAGKYNLSKSMSVDEILEKLVLGGQSGDTIRFTIPEGYELSMIANRLEKENLVKKERFLELTSDKKNFEEEFTFLKDLKSGQSLEGFLFPSTYEVFLNSSEEDIIKKMLKEFEVIYDEDIKEKAKKYNFTLNDVVTLASIIEREGRLDSERPIMSGVFHNRLGINMNLQSCATVQYILGERKPVLSTAETLTPSPYNTYINSGLPPAPIAAPGQTSLVAAVNPADVDYKFFVLTGRDGSHTFSRTLAEHNKAKQNMIRD